MKELFDLKAELKNYNIGNFYIFTGEDYGIKHHYIERIETKYDNVDSTQDVATVNEMLGSSSATLFKSDTLYIIYNDVDFANAKPDYILNFIKRLSHDGVVLIYDIDISKTNLFLSCEQYVTNFAAVSDKIGEYFVRINLKLSEKSIKEMAYNCANDYSTICLEADKVKNYATAMGISDQIAYDDLHNANQLLVRDGLFILDDMLDDLLLGKFNRFGYWSRIIHRSYSDEVWKMLSYIVNNYLIAYLIVEFGKWDGSSLAYEYRLGWTRAKVLREKVFPFPADYYLTTANDIAGLDELVKLGKLDREKVFDYFITMLL